VHTDPEELDAMIARLAEARGRCQVCGHPVDAGRIRCVTCPAPPLPETYRLARERLRAIATKAAS
jgi:hypothetical protein